MIKSIRTHIIASIKNKRINVFLLFLLSSFVILIFTKLSKEYTKTIPFEIEKFNVPQEFVILNDSINLNITLKTFGFNWLRYAMSKPKIAIDFSKDVSKEGSVFIYNKSKAYLNNTQFDKNIEVLNLEPERLVFRYDVNLVKKLPIKINTDIQYRIGYDRASEVIAEPDSVVIVGPEMLVSEYEFLETDTLKLNNIRGDIKQSVNLKLPYNDGDLKISVARVTLTAKVEKFTEGAFKIPVELINVPKGLQVKYFPKEVTVSYYVSLSDFKMISKKDFKVICDFQKVNESQTVLKPELVLFPEVAQNTKIDYQRIEFITTK